MTRHKSNIMRSAVTMMAMLTVLCCLLIMAGTATGDHCGFAFVCFAAMVVEAVVFVVWLIWTTYVFATKKTLIPMSRKSYKILDCIDFMLFAYWVVVWFVPAAIGPWIVWPMAAVWIASLVITLRNK